MCLLMRNDVVLEREVLPWSLEAQDAQYGVRLLLLNHDRVLYLILAP